MLKIILTDWMTYVYLAWAVVIAVMALWPRKRPAVEHEEKSQWRSDLSKNGLDLPRRECDNSNMINIVVIRRWR